MNTLKTVYNKLFSEKTELAKHEVELSVVDDLKKMVSMSDNQLKTNKNLQSVLFGMVDNINNKLKELDKVNNDNLEMRKNVEVIYNNFKKSAQDLGIDYKNTEGAKLYEQFLKNSLLMNAKKTVIDSIKILIK